MGTFQKHQEKWGKNGSVSGVGKKRAIHRQILRTCLRNKFWRLGKNGGTKLHIIQTFKKGEGGNYPSENMKLFS